MMENYVGLHREVLYTHEFGTKFMLLHQMEYCRFWVRRYLECKRKAIADAGANATNDETEDTWIRRDYAAKMLKGTGSGGPPWDCVLSRSVIDMESQEVLENKRIMNGLSKTEVPAPLNKVRNIETTLFYREGVRDETGLRFISTPVC